MNEAKKDRKRPIYTIKPRTGHAPTQTGAGAHKDKKKADKQGDVKHKKKDYAEGLEELLSKIVKENRDMNDREVNGNIMPAEGMDEPEGETLKNSLHTIIRVATHLDKRLDVNDDFPEWVSEKMGAIKGMMVSVMDYLISDQEMSQDPDAMEGYGFGDTPKPQQKNTKNTFTKKVPHGGLPESKGWTHDSLADRLFEHERTYEEKLANMLRKISK